MSGSQIIGQRLLEAFQTKGITSKAAIAAALGYKSDKSIYKVINGEQELSFKALRRFREKTDHSVDWLLFGPDALTRIGVPANPEKEGDPTHSAAIPRQANEVQPDSESENSAELRLLLKEYFQQAELAALFHSLSLRERAELMAIAKGIANPDSIPIAHAVAPQTEIKKKAS